MPSHIFTRLGYWQESIASNIASANASKDMRSRLHAWDYMIYAYLQSGQDEDAKSMVDATAALQKIEGENFTMAYALAAIPVRYALERGRWGEAAKVALSPGELDFGWQRFPNAEAVNAFGPGLGAARSGDVATARKEVERLGKLRQAMLEAKQPYPLDSSRAPAIRHHAAPARTKAAEPKNSRLLMIPSVAYLYMINITSFVPSSRFSER
jgi:hypothetical protein